MIRSLALMALALTMSLSAIAADSAGFNKRFQLVKNDEGKVIAIRLRVISQRFTLKPFIEQIKNDILEGQRRLRRQGFMGLEAEVDSMLESM